MKHQILSTLVLVLALTTSYSQNVGIGTSTPNSSAILDLTSTTKGFLLPRMDSAQRKAIESPSQGLMLMQKGLVYVYSDSAWGYIAANKNQTLSVSANSSTWDCSKGLNASLTLSDNTSIDIRNTIPGMIGIISIKQDATGSRKLTLPAGSKVSGGGNGMLTLSTDPGAVDIVSFYFDGENFFWNMKSNFN